MSAGIPSTVGRSASVRAEPSAPRRTIRQPPNHSRSTLMAMTGEADIARTAALIADPTRATILDALVDGRALPPSELAAAAGVSRSTVSERLSKMLDAGLLAVEHGGRNRYYRLAGPEVASALEALAVISPAREV